MGDNRGTVAAVVLAAGQSSRMGRPKLVLPYGSSTVIEHITGVLMNSGIERIVVITGGARAEVEEALKRHAESNPRLIFAHNEQFAQTEMLASLHLGIQTLNAFAEVDALMVVLGDQPTIESEIIRALVAKQQTAVGKIVIPSYQMRRGHPWILPRQFWKTLLALPPERTLRDFLADHREDIAYVEAQFPGVLADMDTPEDYRRLRDGNHPGNG